MVIKPRRITLADKIANKHTRLSAKFLILSIKKAAKIKHFTPYG
jgi:hypothetical protein